MDAQTATASYDCKFPGCTNEASSPVGRYSYCRAHQDRAARGQAPLTVAKIPAGRSSGTSVVQTIHDLASLAREVDKAHAKATKLTEQALAAKREADSKAAEFRAEARRLIGSEVDGPT